MSVKNSNSDDSSTVKCERCGYECDPRGLSQHEESARCDYLKDEKFRQENGYTKSLSHANRKIRNWIRNNTEDGVEKLCSRFSLGGPSWDPDTGYKYYTTPEAWETFLCENRLTNPEEQADGKVKIHSIGVGSVVVEIETNDESDEHYSHFMNESGIENRRKAWVRHAENGDIVLYTVDGDRIGEKI